MGPCNLPWLSGRPPLTPPDDCGLLTVGNHRAGTLSAVYRVCHAPCGAGLQACEPSATPAVSYSMKPLLAVILATLLGIAAGVGIAALRIGRVGPRADLLLPNVEVDHLEYDFDMMDLHGQGNHDFLFTNRGEGTLELAVGPTSCRCTLSRLEKSSIPPGESARVTLTWTAEGLTENYEQTAKIRTNDPRQRQIVLRVSGRIVMAVQPEPAKLIFSSVTQGESITGEVRVYCFLDEPLEILGFELQDADTAEYFEVTADEPLPPGQLQEKTGARSGRLVRVTVKPGLPRGEFQQKIILKTNLAAAPTVELPVVGEVVSPDEITILGPGWNDQIRVLDFGDPVDSRKGAQRKLLLVVRGRHRKDVNFEVVRRFPDLLDVKLEKKSGSNELLIVRVPAGSRPANHLGSQQGPFGEILIKTGHPQVPQLRIRVRFAVVEREDEAG